MRLYLDYWAVTDCNTGYVAYFKIKNIALYVQNNMFQLNFRLYLEHECINFFFNPFLCYISLIVFF